MLHFVNMRPGPGAGRWRSCYRTVRNQGQIGPEVNGTTDIRNTLQVPMTTIIPAGRSILLRKASPDLSLTCAMMTYEL